MPNYYKILLKNYYIYHFRHQTINVCHIAVKYRLTTVFHPGNFFVIYFFTIYRYRYRYRDIFQISYRYVSKLKSDIDPSLVWKFRDYIFFVREYTYSDFGKFKFFFWRSGANWHLQVGTNKNL